MMPPKVESYVALSDQYWQHGQKLLAEKDWPQASEKLWGTTAELVKAVAEEKGWKHDGHGSLFAVIDRLIKESGKAELRFLFHEANSCHINFYENWFTPNDVLALAPRIVQLREELKKFLTA